MQILHEKCAKYHIFSMHRIEKNTRFMFVNEHSLLK